MSGKLWLTLGICSALLGVAGAGDAAAQAGRIVGRVTNPQGEPLPDAIVTVVGTTRSATTNLQGRYQIPNVAAGTYTIQARRIGAQPKTVPGVTVSGQGDATADVTLEPAAQELTTIVVSASRRAEKITDAPATITRLDAPTIENSVGNSFNGALKQVKGIDFIQMGVTAAAINARGFNSSFNNRMLMMEDGRIATLPESGLPLGGFTALSKIDLAGVEVLVGPGSALYGADASNGVVTLETKDPMGYRGTTVEVSGGNRGYADVQARHAGVSGKWGYKVTGEYQHADDFENTLNYAPVAPRTTRTPEIGIDFTNQVRRANGALVYYGGNLRVEGSGGWSSVDGVGQTNVGRNQLDNYSYNFQQVRATLPRWYFNLYRAGTSSGSTYAINGFSQNRLALPTTISDDSVRRLSAFPGGSTLFAGEIQNNFEIAALGHTRVILGVQGRHDQITSKRRWLDDRKTGKDIDVDQVGGYAQVETPVGDKVRLVAAARYDKHQDYEGQFSPKAAILVTPIPDNTLRLSVNRAFKSPTTLQTHFFFPDFSVVAPGIGVGVLGNREGLTLRDAAGIVLQTFDPLVPESNTTWELGYKGVIKQQLFVDVTGYRARYKQFLSPLTTLNNLFRPAAQGGPTFIHLADGSRFTGATGNNQITLAYLNLGKATLKGIDAGVRWQTTSRIGVSGTYSYVHLTPVDTAGQRPQIIEATALNTTPIKWTLGMDFVDLVPKFLGGFTVRSVKQYPFRSGVNNGLVPRFRTLDLSLGYRMPSLNSQLNLAVNNLFACSHGRYVLGANQAIPGTLDQETKCGFGQKHLELVNAPEIGTTVFLGIRYQR